MAFVKCGRQITAEIKEGKYIFYHCTGIRGGPGLTLRKPYRFSSF